MDSLVQSGLTLLRCFFSNETFYTPVKKTTIKKNLPQINQTSLLKNKFLSLLGEYEPKEEEKDFSFEKGVQLPLDVHDKKWCSMHGCGTPDAHKVELLARIGNVFMLI